MQDGFPCHCWCLSPPGGAFLEKEALPTKQRTRGWVFFQGPAPSWSREGSVTSWPAVLCPWAALCAQGGADSAAGGWVGASLPASPHPALLPITHAEKEHKCVFGKHSQALLCVIGTNPLSAGDQTLFSHFLILLSPQVWAGVSPCCVSFQCKLTLRL